MSQNFDFFPLGQEVSLREGFGRALVTLGRMRSDFYLFDADVAGGTGAKPFAGAFPERVVQFGIAEQNLMAAAAGFADTGLIPLVAGFASFTVMRAHEQLRTAVCYGGRNVKICCSHVGLDAGPDGATAQMLEDLATCRAIPGLTVVVPACANEIQPMLAAILNAPGPVYMRIGRSPSPIIYENPGPIRIGQGDILRNGDDMTLIACGTRVAAALKAADLLATKGISARVVNMRSIKPLDHALIEKCCIETGAIVTVEDHSALGGLGGAVAESVVQVCPVPMEIVAVRDLFGRSGEHSELFGAYGIDVADIVAAALKAQRRRHRS
ncbi:MAG: hypothetical protein HYV06_02315 [Deltaproteobacteria bacterium]|nr:hypothetical protein [Deltaproteobacteria bacterium]